MSQRRARKLLGLRHPRELGAAEVAAFLSHLAERERLSAATQNQAFGLWAQGRMRLEEARLRAGALDKGSEVEIAPLRDEVGEVRRELGEVQERLDFAERLLSQAREVDRLPRLRNQ